MNTTTILKTARYIIINGIFAALIYFGMFNEYAGTEYIEGLENLALFMGWGTGLLGAIILLAINLEKKQGGFELAESIARSHSSVVPFAVDCTFDIIVSAAFIFAGHYVLAIFYILSIYAGKTIRDIPKNIMMRKLKSQEK